MDTFATGLIVGRFHPPHLGHSWFIDEAARRCERLVVFVNTRSGETVPGALRARWLADLHPHVTVREVAHDLNTDWNDEALWGKWINLFRSHWPHASGPHAVFSSDSYVAELARRPSRPDLAPDPRLPADTRLWATLQEASGGVWAGCVHDERRIAARLCR